MIVNKITHGFVIQQFDDHSGRCIAQDFIAGDNVEWETISGEPISCPENETYQPFEMVQPALNPAQ